MAIIIGTEIATAEPTPQLENFTILIMLDKIIFRVKNIRTVIM
jgi:hypothetical protein